MLNITNQHTNSRIKGSHYSMKDTHQYFAMKQFAIQNDTKIEIYKMK